MLHSSTLYAHMYGMLKSDSCVIAMAQCDQIQPIREINVMPADQQVVCTCSAVACYLDNSFGMQQVQVMILHQEQLQQQQHRPGRRSLKLHSIGVLLAANTILTDGTLKLSKVSCVPAVRLSIRVGCMLAKSQQTDCEEPDTCMHDAATTQKRSYSVVFCASRD